MIPSAEVLISDLMDAQLQLHRAYAHRTTVRESELDAAQIIEKEKLSAKLSGAYQGKNENERKTNFEAFLQGIPCYAIALAQKRDAEMERIEADADVSYLTQKIHALSAVAELVVSLNKSSVSGL